MDRRACTGGQANLAKDCQACAPDRHLGYLSSQADKTFYRGEQAAHQVSQVWEVVSISPRGFFIYVQAVTPVSHVVRRTCGGPSLLMTLAGLELLLYRDDPH